MFDHLIQYAQDHMSIHVLASYSTVGGSPDRYHVEIPYCGKQIPFYIIFDSLNPQVPPDFLLPETQEHAIDYSSIFKDSWDYKNPEQFMCILYNLKALYANYHKSLIHSLSNEKVRFDCETAISIEDSEFYVSSFRTQEVICDIPVHIDPQLLLPYAQTMDIDSKPILRCNYTQTPNFQIKHPKSWLDKIPEISPPRFEKDMCLADYVSSVEKNYKSAITSIEERKILVSDIIKVFGSVVDYDATMYTQVCVLSTHLHTAVSIIFYIPLSYPKEKPKFSLHIFNSLSKQIINVKKIQIRYDEFHVKSKETMINVIEATVKDSIQKAFIKIGAK